MTTRDAANADATDTLGHPGSGAADDAEPEGLEPSQDGSIGGAMSSQADDDTPEAPAEGVGDDEDDESEAGFSPKLQRKLREAAKARQELSTLQGKVREFEQIASAFEAVINAPNPAQLIQAVREARGMKQSAPQDLTEDLIPKEDFGFEPDVKKGLDAYWKSAMGGLIAKLEDKLQPMFAEVGHVKSQRAESEWSGLAKQYGEGIGKWKSQYDKFRANGMSPKAALAAASEGEAMRMPAAKAAAAKQSESLTKPLLTGRGSNGLRPKNPVATTFQAFLEAQRMRRP